MAIFNSYVSLPEGTWYIYIYLLSRWEAWNSAVNDVWCVTDLFGMIPQHNWGAFFFKPQTVPVMGVFFPRIALWTWQHWSRAYSHKTSRDTSHLAVSNRQWCYIEGNPCCSMHISWWWSQEIIPGDAPAVLSSLMVTLNHIIIALW